jgi:hypothetical protein
MTYTATPNQTAGCHDGQGPTTRPNNDGPQNPRPYQPNGGRPNQGSGYQAPPRQNGPNQGQRPPYNAMLVTGQPTVPIQPSPQLVPVFQPQAQYYQVPQMAQCQPTMLFPQFQQFIPQPQYQSQPNPTKPKKKAKRPNQPPSPPTQASQGEQSGNSLGHTENRTHGACL